MKKLLVYLKNYKKETLLGPLFKLIEAAFELLVPLVIASIIDKGIAYSDKTYIIQMSLVLVLLGVIGLISSITAQYFAAKASAGFAKKAKYALFKHIQTLTFSQMDRIGSSTFITRLTSDMNQVQTGINLTLRLLLRSPFVVFGAMIMAVTIDVQSSLIFIAIIPLLSLVVFGVMLWCIPLYKKVQLKLDGVLGITRENLTGVRVIRAFAKEDKETERFINENESLSRLQKHVGVISSLMNPMTYVLINIAILILLWTGAIRVESGLITQGTVVALYNYMSQILVELIKLANLIITITKSIASGNRIQNIFDLNPDMEGNETMSDIIQNDEAVRFSHVNLRYNSTGDYALNDVSFSIKHGSIIGVIGGTGSGKTSLINLIPRFYDATEGEVCLYGVNVRRYPFHVLRQKIGIVPQQAVLFKGSIRDNLRWGKADATDEEINEAIALAQAKDVAEQKGGLDFIIEQGGKNLSGGQKQRFTIARALVRKPDLLILDDSSSALDFATDAALRKSIMGMSNRPTVIIVSQRASSLQHADQIIVLDDGRVVGIGTDEELFNNCSVYREIYESQFEKEVTEDGTSSKQQLNS